MEDNDTALAVNQPSHMLQIIDKVVQSGLTAESVGVLEKMLNMQERIMADQRKTAFMAALSRLQARLPQITKDGRIDVTSSRTGNSHSSRYARLEDLDRVIRPLLSEEGFAFSFNEEEANGQSRRYSARLSHRDGHSEMKHITLPLDTSGSKNSVQAAGSSFSYAQRYLIKAHLNIVEKGEDTDGNDVEPITEDEARDLNTQLQDVKMDLKRFLEYMQVAELAQILKRDMGKAQNAIDVRRFSLKQQAAQKAPQQ